MVKEYGELLQHDQHYASKAARISELSRDISKVIQKEDLSRLGNAPGKTNVAFHNPCTLQHGLKLNGTVETILAKTYYKLMPVADSHLCCGSAGTYSILEPGLSQQLLDNKIASLEKHTPDVTATANIGCQLHLSSKARQPVKHWIELLIDLLA